MDDMEKSLQSAELDHANYAVPGELKEGIVSDIVADDDVGETVFLLHGAQVQTKVRLGRVISFVRAELATFDTEE